MTEIPLYAKHLTKAHPKLTHKPKIFTRNNIFGQAMWLEDVVPKQLSCVFCRCGRFRGDEVSHLGESVYCNKYSVIASCFVFGS